MKKTFLVGCLASRDFLVKAETPEEAIDIAHEEYHGGFDFEIEEFRVEDEMTDPKRIEMEKKNGAVDIYDA